MSPAIHILAGEKVCIQVMTPAHSAATLAAMQTCSMASGPVRIGFHTTFAGNAPERSSASAISRELRATLARVSSPYKCWLPVSSQSSCFFCEVMVIKASIWRAASRDEVVRSGGVPKCSQSVRLRPVLMPSVNVHMKPVKEDNSLPNEAARAPTGKRKAAVMADVATLAGVSYQTVSRVLHDSPNVHEETRARVVAAIRQLDYRPNTMARALVTGRSHALGVVSFDTTQYGPASTLFGIQQAAHEAGYAVSISSLRALNRDTVLSAIQQLRDQGMDGVAVIAPLRAGVDALRHFRSDFPVVAVEAGPDASIPVATVDQKAGAKAATEHLLSLGHKTVWHLAGPTDWKEAEDRIEGWKSALKAAGARVPALIRGDWTARSGYEAAQTLLQIEELTAVLVGNDQMALGLLAPVARSRPQSAERTERGRLRRHPRIRLLHPAVDHRSAGLCRAWPALPARSTRPNRRQYRARTGRRATGAHRA